MKKFSALALAVVMTLLLVSCAFVPSEPSRGTFEGDVYTSEYLGLSFTKPESWVYATDEEIAAALDLGVDMFLDENFKAALENNSSVYDMLVTDTLTGSNVIVGFENLSKTFSSNITVEQYIESLKAQLANVSEMAVTFPESFQTATLGETEFTKVDCVLTVQGGSMQQVYYLNKAEKVMRYVIVTIPSGYTAEQIEAMFR